MTLLRAVTTLESFRILETRALVYAVSFAFMLGYQLEARDQLHLAVATLGGAGVLVICGIVVPPILVDAIRDCEASGGIHFRSLLNRA